MYEAQNRLLRQLEHVLSWSGMVLELLWVKGKLHSTNIPSKNYTTPHDMVHAALHMKVKLDM